MSCENTQFELFPFLRGRYARVAPPRYLLKDLTLSVENTIVLAIVAIMVVVLFFSFGVERGKRIVRSVLEDKTNGQTNAAALPVTPERPDLKVFQEITPDQKKVTTQGPSPDERLPGGMEVVPESVSLVVSKTQAKQHPALGTFTIQVASFKERENAQKEAKRLEKRGYPIFVLPKGNHSIVCVGKFAFKDEATEFFHKLKKSYNDCVIRRL